MLHQKTPKYYNGQPIGEREEPSTASPAVCPRCKDSLRQSYPDQEPECLPCGYVAYSFNTRPGGYARHILQRGASFILRYIGDYEAMKDVTIVVSFRSLNPATIRRTGAAFGKEYEYARQRFQGLVPDACPWCKGLMLPSSLSGHRRNLTEQRYVCKYEHRLSVIPIGKGDEWGWK